MVVIMLKRDGWMSWAEAAIAAEIFFLFLFVFINRTFAINYTRRMGNEKNVVGGGVQWRGGDHGFDCQGDQSSCKD